MKRKDLIIKATKDFYGVYSPDAKIVWKYLRKKKGKLTDEQKDAVWHIRTNLTDLVYRKSLLTVG